jgi:cysteine-rich repeat protein
MVFRPKMSGGGLKSLTSTDLPADLSSGQAFILRLTLTLGMPEGPIAPTTLSLSFTDHGGNVASLSVGILGAVSLCEAPMGDCDQEPLNGCETELITSLEHCGVCGNACVTANGAGACIDGACVFSCDDGYTGPDCAEKVISCADGILNCGENANCVISQGAPTCLCDTHFQGDGQLCKPICGDGVIVGSEVCDDGNSREGDGCRYDCAGLEICGDGLLDPAADEVCDDGNMITGDGCDDRCELEPFEGPCGDGVLNLGEECDDSNNVSGDGCNECVLMMTDAWTCDPQVFKAGDGCDCGCGQIDPDCEDDTAESCDFCGGQGTCNPQDPACQLIESASNFQCK